MLPALCCQMDGLDLFVGASTGLNAHSSSLVTSPTPPGSAQPFPSEQAQQLPCSQISTADFQQFTLGCSFILLATMCTGVAHDITHAKERWRAGVVHPQCT